MKKSKWISVDERLPEVGVMVLVVIDLDGSCQYETDCLKEDGTWKYETPNLGGDKIVAWCPIPELPQRILKKMR